MAKILVVDDQRNMRTTLAIMLRSAGHEVDEAADGDAAIEMASQGGYDLVLTDLKMGGRDGMIRSLPGPAGEWTAQRDLPAPSGKTFRELYAQRARGTS